MFDYYRYIAFFQTPWVPEIVISVFDYETIGQVFCGKRSGLAVGKMSPEDVEAYKYSISRPGIKYSLYKSVLEMIILHLLVIIKFLNLFYTVKPVLN